jgi:hypothetical protein
VPPTIPAKLTVNFVLPSQYEIQAKEVTSWALRNLGFGCCSPPWGCWWCVT